MKQFTLILINNSLFMKRLFILSVLLLCSCLSEVVFAQQYITTKRVYIPGSIARHNLFSADYSFADYHTKNLTVAQTKVGTVPCGKQFEVAAIDTVGYKMYKIIRKGKYYYINRYSVEDNYLLNSSDPNIRPEFKSDVLAGTVSLGMKPYEVICSKGEPKDKNVTITSSVRHEQWVYDWGYVYLENDVVTSIQF